MKIDVRSQERLFVVVVKNRDDAGDVTSERRIKLKTDRFSLQERVGSKPDLVMGKNSRNVQSVQQRLLDGASAAVRVRVKATNGSFKTTARLRIGILRIAA